MSISQAIPNVQSFSGSLATPVSEQRPAGPLGGLSSPKQPIDGIDKPDYRVPLTEICPPIVPERRLVVCALGLSPSAMVRVGHLWLPNETVSQLRLSPLSQSPLDIARDAVEVGLSHPLTGSEMRLMKSALSINFRIFRFRRRVWCTHRVRKC